MPICTLTNFLSFLRVPLALLFIIDNPLSRCVIILLAMLTDFLDGYLARRWKMTSQVGAFLDPLTDKFFVMLAAIVLIQEGKLELWQALTMISRDFAVVLFGLYLLLKGFWPNFKFQSIWSGKIMTTFQFLVLLALIFNYTIPSYFFITFITLGLLALIELFAIKLKQEVSSLQD
jgi:CDP-diacylglycerol--glycerol-3-phosphate 3-phosphatidyltransferase